MEFKKVNITLPVQLYEQSKDLVEKGLYSNFSDLVRSGLRKKIREEQESPKKPREWKEIVESIRSKLKNTELAKLSKDGVIRRLRHSRDKIYDEEYGQKYSSS
ncbi:hypothetical protein HYS31_01415 [Candidatus Woesearchaeota archaeon]|nr:hypothetical protein [Candidatus Woesearchaeota archaeon]